MSVMHRRKLTGKGLEYAPENLPQDARLALMKVESQKLLAETPFLPALDSVRNQEKPCPLAPSI